MTRELFIGLMSGTSLDGVDAALVEFNVESNSMEYPHVIATHFAPYPQGLRAEILALQHPTENELEVTALTGNILARLYADAVNELLVSANIPSAHIMAIGCHGQTIRHRPELGFTLQIGNPALLAELTGITTVADFRSRDIAAGGQGAPLVPAFHQAVFTHKQRSRAIINIGGIANITYLGNDADVFGFDSGPGNMLLDAWIKQHLNLDYDADGAWANTGTVIEPLLLAMMADPYFTATPPKSTGRDLFNVQWLTAHLLNLTSQNYQPADVARTLVALSTLSIFNALSSFCGQVDEVYLCGGGAKNNLIKQSLQKLLGDTKLSTTDDLGIGIDWAEAIAFAWLARQCIHQQTSNLPEVTGARGSRILGAIYQD